MPRTHLSDSMRSSHGMFAKSFSESNVQTGALEFSWAVVTNLRQKCIVADPLGNWVNAHDGITSTGTRATQTDAARTQTR